MLRGAGREGGRGSGGRVQRQNRERRIGEVAVAVRGYCLTGASTVTHERSRPPGKDACASSSCDSGGGGGGAMVGCKQCAGSSSDALPYVILMTSLPAAP